MTHISFHVLEGKVLSDVSSDRGEEVLFVTSSGDRYMMMQIYDNFRIEKIEGDLNDLIGHRVIKAKQLRVDDYDEDYGITESWVSYHIVTCKGAVIIRWYGKSDDYSPSDVSFIELENNGII